MKKIGIFCHIQKNKCKLQTPCAVPIHHFRQYREFFTYLWGMNGATRGSLVFALLFST